MDKTKAKLIYFLDKYGNDFFHKLPKYKTAFHPSFGTYVKLLTYYPKSLSFDTEDSYGNTSQESIFELDNFGL